MFLPTTSNIWSERGIVELSIQPAQTVVVPTRPTDDFLLIWAVSMWIFF